MLLLPSLQGNDQPYPAQFTPCQPPTLEDMSDQSEIHSKSKPRNQRNVQGASDRWKKTRPAFGAGRRSVLRPWGNQQQPSPSLTSWHPCMGTLESSRPGLPGPFLKEQKRSGEYGVSGAWSHVGQSICFLTAVWESDDPSLHGSGQLHITQAARARGQSP